MRKYTLGLLIGLIFLAYTTVLRHQHSEPVIAPSSLSQNNSSSSSGAAGSANSAPTSTNNSGTSSSAQYQDGTYTGSTENAYYGNVQVSATVQSGKITNVNFLQYPNDNPNSIYVNQQAIPYLKQEAIQSQSSNVSIITGATFTSQAFVQSLANALNQANHN